MLSAGRPDATPLSRFAGRALLASFLSHYLTALACNIAMPDLGPLHAGTAGLLLVLAMAAISYPVSFMAAYHTVFGEKFVSHDVVTHDVVPAGVLVAAFVVFVLSTAAYRRPWARLLAYSSIALFTGGGIFNFYAWGAQGGW